MARQYSEDFLYNHVIRSWLFGVLILDHNTIPKLQQNTDLEVHALGALLHDVGIAFNASFITPDRRFEIDGAFAATDFVKDQVKHDHRGSAWDVNRLQLLWDSIALSSEAKISLYKEASVAAVTYGVGIDLFGPENGITQAEYDKIVAEFPYLDFVPGINRAFMELVERKPNSTYG